MSTDWFVMRGTTQSGPYTMMVLWELAGAGKLHKDDWVLQGGSDVWVPITKVVELPSASVSSARLGAAAAPRPAAKPVEDGCVDFGSEVMRGASGVRLGQASSARLGAASSARLAAHSSARLAAQSSARLAAQSSARLAAAQSSARLAAQSSARLPPPPRPAAAPPPRPAHAPAAVGIVVSCPSCRGQCRIPAPQAPTNHRCPACKRGFRAVNTTVGVVTRAVDEAGNPTVHQAPTNVR